MVSKFILDPQHRSRLVDHQRLVGKIEQLKSETGGCCSCCSLSASPPAMSETKLVIKNLLALVLAIVLIGMGVTKLTPLFMPTAYAAMEAHFNKAVLLSPVSVTKWSGETLRVLVGVTEVWFGLLALCPLYTRLSSFMLVLMMANATYSRVALKEPPVPLAIMLAVSIALYFVLGALRPSCRPGGNCPLPAAVANKKKS